MFVDLYYCYCFIFKFLLENGWPDLAHIAKKRFIQKKSLGKSTGKVGNVDEKNTTVAQQYIIILILIAIG